MTHKPDPIGLIFIMNCLNRHGITFVREYQFSKRKFRFDVACKDIYLGIEYDGLLYSGRGGHQTVAGVTSNNTKMNMAQLLGWTVLRYTHKNFDEFENDLILFLLKINK